jgi:hypothetical protein
VYEHEFLKNSGRDYVITTNEANVILKKSQELAKSYSTPAMDRHDNLSPDTKSTKILPGSLIESMFLPLDFGGKNAHIKIEVYGSQRHSNWADPIIQEKAFYLVITTKTEYQGTIQWSIYLKGNDLALQVYSNQAKMSDQVQQVVQTAEIALRQQGYRILYPTVFLKYPFQVPKKFIVELRG